MYVIKDSIDLQELKRYGYKRYLNGYSKIIKDPIYRFLDILDKDKIIKKVKLEKGKFIYDNVEADDIRDLIDDNLIEEVLE